MDNFKLFRVKIKVCSPSIWTIWSQIKDWMEFVALPRIRGNVCDIINWVNTTFSEQYVLVVFTGASFSILIYCCFKYRNWIYTCSEVPVEDLDDVRNELFSTADFSQHRCIEMLKSHAGLINMAHTDDGYTLLMRACMSQTFTPALVKYMIEIGADVNATSQRGDSAFTLFAYRLSKEPYKWNSQILQYLLNAGCDVNHTNIFGCTALHYAAKEGHLLLTAWLLKHGANPQIRDKKYHAPADVASYYKKKCAAQGKSTEKFDLVLVFLQIKSEQSFADNN